MNRLTDSKISDRLRSLEGWEVRDSSHAAMRTCDGVELRHSLQRQGIVVETRSVASLPEESPGAYKDVDEVARACEGAGLSRPVARLRPVGVLKG